MVSTPPPDNSTGPLAEFVALRQEIDRRSTAQQGILVLQITAAGTIGGLVLHAPGKTIVLLVVPLVSFALSCLYLDNAFQIARNARYITEKLSDQVPGGLGWEKWQRRTPHSQAHNVSWKLSLFAVFPLVGAVALAWSGPPALTGTHGVASWAHVGLIVTWILGALATAGMALLIRALTSARA